MGPGYFGKFPSHGDFITRRLPRDGFLDIWDRWLQNALATSREQLRRSLVTDLPHQPAMAFRPRRRRLRTAAMGGYYDAQRRQRRPLFPFNLSR